MAGYEIIDGVGMIPDGVTVIEREAFEDRKDLKSVIIPSSVTEIGSDAFPFVAVLTWKASSSPRR